MTSMNAGQQQALVHLAVTTRPHGSSTWDAAGVAKHVAALVNKGLSAQEVINRTLGHAWDRAAKTPGVLATPVRMAAQVEASNPVPYPARREHECPLHPGEQIDSCRACAADALHGDKTPIPNVPRRYDDPPEFDEQGNRLRHTPLRDIFNRTKAELSPADQEATE